MQKSFFSFIVMTALIAAISTSCKKDETEYTVTFDSQGGSTVATQMVRKGGKITEPADPTLANYHFLDWVMTNNGTTPWDFETETVKSDMTLYARWILNTYAVTFDSNGGSAVATQTVTHGRTAAEPADPTRNGYLFDGWFNGNNEWNFATSITAPVTLTAKWTVAHVVKFNSDGGSAVTDQTIRHGDKATKPSNPTRNGYAFDGWFNGGTEWDFAVAITSPVTLTAKWTALYTVTFNSAGGSEVAAQSIRDGNRASRPTNPSRGGAGLYRGIFTEQELVSSFEGWFFDNAVFDFSTPITRNITLTARWTSVSGTTPVESVAPNDVVAAIAFTKSAPRSYTLLIDQNVEVPPQTINLANIDLTIIGIGRERQITLSSDGALFTVSNYAKLTLGNNITLVGRSATGNGGVNNSSSVVIVNFNSYSANFVMHAGSKITGNTSSNAAVFVNSYGSFTMKGGMITGNGSTSPTSTSSVGGVDVKGSYNMFYMEGGSIKGNPSMADVSTDFGYDSNLTLSGTAEIGNLTLNGTGGLGGNISYATLASDWTGRVSSLNLRGGNSNMATVTGYWRNFQVLRGPALNTTLIGRVTLGKFFSTASVDNTQNISPDYVIASDGRLVINQ